jgi:hypothetical protein
MYVQKMQKCAVDIITVFLNIKIEKITTPCHISVDNNLKVHNYVPNNANQHPILVQNMLNPYDYTG